MWSTSICLLILPLEPSHDPSGHLERTRCWRKRAGPASLPSSSISARRRMSISVLLALRTEISVVVSVASWQIPLTTWMMGVILRVERREGEAGGRGGEVREGGESEAHWVSWQLRNQTAAGMGSPTTSANQAELLDRPLDAPPFGDSSAEPLEAAERSLELDKVANLELLEAERHLAALGELRRAEVDLERVR